jgi:hypothetical protein
MSSERWHTHPIPNLTHELLGGTPLEYVLPVDLSDSHTMHFRVSRDAQTAYALQPLDLTAERLTATTGFPAPYERVDEDPAIDIWLLSPTEMLNHEGRRWEQPMDRAPLGRLAYNYFIHKDGIGAVMGFNSGRATIQASMLQKMVKEHPDEYDHVDEVPDEVYEELEADAIDQVGISMSEQILKNILNNLEDPLRQWMRREVDGRFTRTRREMAIYTGGIVGLFGLMGAVQPESIPMDIAGAAGWGLVAAIVQARKLGKHINDHNTQNVQIQRRAERMTTAVHSQLEETFSPDAFYEQAYRVIQQAPDSIL